MCGSADISLDDMSELPVPTFAVVKAEFILQVLPPALRFWEKLGLHPRAGVKNVKAYMFYEGNSDEKEAELADWLGRLSVVYSVRNHPLKVPVILMLTGQTVQELRLAYTRSCRCLHSRWPSSYSI